MRIGVITREFPPEVYGGAGVHVEHLVAELRRRADLQADVHCFGADRAGAIAYGTDAHLAQANPALAVLGVDLQIAARLAGCDIVHSHTWYANLAGHLAAMLYGIPHVITAHSLEPRRPWKAEQLGGGYRLSAWVERTAYESADALIAVSAGMRADLLGSYPLVDPARVHVVHNGIDPAVYRPVQTTEVLRSHGVDPNRPYVVFVGRITRQKGLIHLLHAAADVDAGVQVVLCAGAPDTADIAAEIETAVAELRRRRDGVVWIREMLDRPDVVELLSRATVFCCPSIYEPLGIVNLEAMACSTAVVASDVGGIPEVVDDGVTGLLARYDARDPRGFEQRLAGAIGQLIGDPGRATRMGAAGRTRAEREFSWTAAAERTVAIYRAVARARCRFG
ncbi:MAG: glycogen synthase [Mycobacteriales bacterium]|nr:MAG: glycogen synthase [Pseudonocardiales bacterium]